GVEARTGGQAKPVEDRPVPLHSILVEEAGRAGESGGEDQAHRDRLTVEPALVPAVELEGMPERVPVVEDGPAVLEVELVLRDDAGLDPGGPGDQLLEQVRVPGRNPVEVGLEEVEDRGL